MIWCLPVDPFEENEWNMYGGKKHHVLRIRVFVRSIAFNKRLIRMSIRTIWRRRSGVAFGKKEHLFRRSIECETTKSNFEALPHVFPNSIFYLQRSVRSSTVWLCSKMWSEPNNHQHQCKGEIPCRAEKNVLVRNETYFNRLAAASRFKVAKQRLDRSRQS